LRSVQDDGAGDEGNGAQSRTPTLSLNITLCETQLMNSTAILASKALYGLRNAPVEYSQELAKHTLVTTGVFSFLYLFVTCVRWILRGLEVIALFRQVPELLSSLRKCCCCGCPGRKPTQAVSRWKALIASDNFWSLEERTRHHEAARTAWSLWSKISRAINQAKKPGGYYCPFTWQNWNVFGGRLRRHIWHRQRRAHQTLRSE